jgi:hypothetical protein
MQGLGVCAESQRPATNHHPGRSTRSRHLRHRCATQRAHRRGRAGLSNGRERRAGLRLPLLLAPIVVHRHHIRHRGPAPVHHPPPTLPGRARAAQPICISRQGAVVVAITTLNANRNHQIIPNHPRHRHRPFVNVTKRRECTNTVDSCFLPGGDATSAGRPAGCDEHPPGTSRVILRRSVTRPESAANLPGPPVRPATS